MTTSNPTQIQNEVTIYTIQPSNTQNKETRPKPPQLRWVKEGSEGKRRVK